MIVQIAQWLKDKEIDYEIRTLKGMINVILKKNGKSMSIPFAADADPKEKYVHQMLDYLLSEIENAT